MKNYFTKHILFALFFTHSLASWSSIQSPMNGSFVNGIIQINSDKGASAEIEYYGVNGWEIIGKSNLSFDTRSLANETHSIRDCYSRVGNDAVCVDNQVWIPKVVLKQSKEWVSNPVEVCVDKIEYIWEFVDSIECIEYDQAGQCVDTANFGVWKQVEKRVPSCSMVDKGYWKENVYAEDQGYWDTHRTCSNNDNTKRTCDPYINLNVNNTLANTLAVTCSTNNKINSAGNVETIKCAASVPGTVSNINWFARVGTVGDFAPLNSCSFNVDRTLVVCANVPAGTYQIKVMGNTSTAKVESSITTIQATTVSISCTPKDAKAGKTGIDITCTAGAQGTPVNGVVMVSGYWTASYVDAKTKQVITVPKFCENLYQCKIPSVPVGTYDVQARAIDIYGNVVISNLEKVIVAPK